MDNYKKYFINVIKDNFLNKSDKIITSTDKHFKNISVGTNFAINSRNPLDKRLNFSSYFLAFIKTLDEEGKTFETVRKNCLEIVTEYVRPKNKVKKILKRLPAKLANTLLAGIVIKSLNKRASHNYHPDGFLATIITDKQEIFGLGHGIDILECGICKLFKKHQYE